MTFLITIAAFVVALGVLIVIHEFGHYLVARWCGVKVLRFSVGFGRALWAKRLGADRTEWMIAAFPLGGYVKMLDEREGEVAERDLPRAFNRQPVSKRFAIVVAGPVANFLLAIVLYWSLFVYGVPGLVPVIGPVTPNTPAAVAGFVSGETIVKIGGEAVTTWQDARWLLLQHAVQRANVTVETRGERDAIAERRFDLSGLTPADLDADFLRALGLSRYRPPLKPVIGTVVAGGAAERDGLKAGDEIAAIDNEPIKSWDRVVEIIRSHPNTQLTVEVRRGGRLLPALAVTPAGVTENEKSVGRIGAAPLVDPSAMAGLIVDVRYGPLESVGKAMHKTWDTSIFSLRMLGKMIVGEVSLKNLSGPITIADYAGQSAQGGWTSYLFFLALVSISLGVLNLLPIPLLDGGHLMYYMLEILKGSPISDRAIEIGQHIGIVLLFTLMTFALYNDIIRLVNG
ncbi:MAG: RIP metalloprotease RseP [Betaproteobacteria bacterium]|nr:RIP metalloprotease RseP [Betaproteobacteria bacterium]